MATVNISERFENNLRKVSEVGVATLNAAISDTGDRLGQGIAYATAADTYLAYTIPADSIATKFYFLVDEAFDAGTTAAITIKSDGTSLVGALDLSSVGPSVSTVVDIYFDAADGIEFQLNQDVTKGKVRVVAEYISGSTNNGIYVAQGA